MIGGLWIVGAIGDLCGTLQRDQEFRRDSKRLFKARQCILITIQPLEGQTTSCKEHRVRGLLLQSQLDLLEKFLRFGITLLILPGELRKLCYQDYGNEKQGYNLHHIVLLD